MVGTQQCWLIFLHNTSRAFCIGILIVTEDITCSHLVRKYSLFLEGMWEGGYRGEECRRLKCHKVSEMQQGPSTHRGKQLRD